MKGRTRKTTSARPPNGERTIKFPRELFRKHGIAAELGKLKRPVDGRARCHALVREKCPRQPPRVPPPPRPATTAQRVVAGP